MKTPRRIALITAFCLSTAFAAPAFATAVHGDAAFTQAANAAVNRIAQKDGFSGVIFVARGDKVLLRKAEGLADRERGIPNTPETKFPLESVTKQFTAAATLLLAEDRKLVLSDPAAKYYPAVPPEWRAITIAQLLMHGGGIRDCMCSGAEYDAASAAFHSYKDFIAFAARQPLAFPPGKGFLYSNAGYAWLGAVIENASGQSYEDFIVRRILVPLGLKHSGVGDIPGGVVKGYIRLPPSASGTAQWTNGNGARFAVMRGFGGVYTTVDDMLLWSKALDGDALLAPQSRAAMFTDYGNDYGFAWRFAEKYGRTLVWHTGNDNPGGYASCIDKFPQEDLTVVAFTNNTGTTDKTATLIIAGKVTTFPASAAREAVEAVENLYFTGKTEPAAAKPN